MTTTTTNNKYVNKYMSKCTSVTPPLKYTHAESVIAWVSVLSFSLDPHKQTKTYTITHKHGPTYRAKLQPLSFSLGHNLS